jgi:hypothetical protein
MRLLQFRFAYVLILFGGILVFFNFVQLQQSHPLNNVAFISDPIIQNEIEIKKLSNLKIIPETKTQDNYVLNINSCILNEHLNTCVPVVKEITTSSQADCLNLADEYKNEFVDLVEKGIDITISCNKISKDIAFDSSLDLQENLL